MEKLNKIIKHLDVSCIVFIENDFVKYVNGKELMSKYLLLPAVNKQNLLDKLDRCKFCEFAEKIVNFEKEFYDLKHTENKEDYLETGEIESYIKTLEEKNGIDIQLDDICQHLSSDIIDIFFQYGVLRSYPSQYNDLLKEFLNVNSTIGVLLYTNITPSEIQSFEEDLLAFIGGKNNATFISIIDNKLGSGDDEGVRIANEHIKVILDRNDKIYGYLIVFTSQTPPADNPDFDNGYFKIVAKTNSPVADISNALSLIAFTKTFTYIHNKTKDAVSNIPAIIKEHKQNIAYIVDKANDEGILPYEAINLWYENAMNYLVNKSIVEEEHNHLFTSTIGLAKLFNEQPVNLTSDSLCLKDIETNELFDYSVNKKHLSIAPGDVFSGPDTFFVIIGQACDIALRSDLTRNSTVAIAVKTSFEEIKKDNGKSKRKIHKDKEYVKLNFFKNIDSKIGFLKIELKTNSTVHLDFDILDMAMYNEDGDCSINLKEQLNVDMQKYLASSSVENYSRIQKKLSELVCIPVEVKTLLNGKVNGTLDYSYDNDVVKYPFKRICRIKGNFNLLIHHNYWHYRSRVDLNEINLTK